MEQTRTPAVYPAGQVYGSSVMGKGLLLWLVGVPIPVILILWLVFR